MRYARLKTCGTYETIRNEIKSILGAKESKLDPLAGQIESAKTGSGRKMLPSWVGSAHSSHPARGGDEG